MVLQILAGGLVELAHAGEPETAPVGIEAHHDASCVVLHDALRCALCQFASSHTMPVAGTTDVGARVLVRTTPVHIAAAIHRPAFSDPAARPRAPPTLLA